MTEPQNGEKVTTTIEAPESVAVEIPVRTGPCTLDTIVIGQTGVQLDGVIANGGFNVIRRALEPTEGGCKILHVAKHPIKQRHIPPKEARREFKRRREELRRESLARARLKGHENIVAMGGYKRGLLLLEPLLYAEGWRPLSDYLGADDPSLTNSDLENLKINPAPQLKPADIIQIAMGVVGGVKTINEAGLIHCDIKPDNIMIGRTENEGYLVKFIDFGSVLFEREDDHPAKNSDGKTVVTCSVPYASIEQLRDTFKIDQRTDQFSLALVLSVLLFKKHPFYSEKEREEKRDLDTEARQEDYKKRLAISHPTLPSIRALEPVYRSLMRANQVLPKHRHLDSS